MVLQQLAPFLDLFLTSPCLLCQRSSQSQLCEDCQQQLKDCQQSQPLLRQPLRSPMPHSQTSQASSTDLIPLVSWGRYEGSLKRAIAQLKYHNNPALAEPLGSGLAEAWLQSQPTKQFFSFSSPFSSSLFSTSQAPYVIPVPMYAAKQKERGFNQAELIARSFCRYTGLPLLADGLTRIQATQPQFGLSAAERQHNVSQAFVIGPGLIQKQRRPVLLLDDIYTTGATVGAIAQVLTSAKIPIAGVVAVAKTNHPKNRAEPSQQYPRRPTTNPACLYS